MRHISIVQACVFTVISRFQGNIKFHLSLCINKTSIGHISDPEFDLGHSIMECACLVDFLYISPDIIFIKLFYLLFKIFILIFSFILIPIQRIIFTLCGFDFTSRPQQYCGRGKRNKKDTQVFS